MSVLGRLVAECTEARRQAGLSQATLGRLVGWSQSEVSRWERMAAPEGVHLVDVARIGSVLGLRLGASLYPFGEPIRDAGHQALIGRFIGVVGATWRVAREVPLPNIGDPRAWDLVLRVVGCIVGVECETRVRDLQALVRRLHQRERDGGVDVVLLVLANTKLNRELVNQVRVALGPEFATPPRRILKSLRAGQPLPGSGVVLL